MRQTGPEIGIVGPAELPGHILQRIHADLDELPTLHRFDVVDLGTVSDAVRVLLQRVALRR